MSGQLLLINPRKRKAARKAAPRRAKAKTRARRAPVVVMANPSPRRRRSRLSHIRRSVRKVRRNPSARLSVGSITSMAKAAGIGAVGALAVDVLFGYARGMLPASMQSPVDAAGALNPMYFVAKGGVAVALGLVGKKVTKHAGAMAEGSLTVSAYEIMRSFVPAAVQLGQVIPARLASAPASSNRVAGYVSGGRSTRYVPAVMRQGGVNGYVS